MVFVAFSTVKARACKRISSGRAFNKRAVRPTEAIVTLTPVIVAGIPGIIILGTDVETVGAFGGVGKLNGELAIISVVGVVVSKLLDRLASTMSVAVIRARRAATTFAPVSFRAYAFASFAVTASDTGALDTLSVVVVCLRGCSPGTSGWASTFRAIRSSPCGYFSGKAEFRFAALEACAAVLRVRLTCSVPTAGIRAEGVCASNAHGDRSKEESGTHDVFLVVDGRIYKVK